MKRFTVLALAIVISLSSLAFAGCGENNTKSRPTTEATAATTAETTSQPSDNEELSKYLNSFIEGDEEIYGVWSLEYMTVIFRNDNLAELVMGSEGYFSKYQMDKKKKLLAVQLLPNTIDGAYTYNFSDDGKTLTLTLDSQTLTLEKQSDFSMIPKAPKNPKTDSSILGWWENSEGWIYYFGNDGIMYNNAGSRETCYTYSTENGKIKAVYTYGGELEENLTYKVKGKKLVIDGETYTRK